MQLDFIKGHADLTAEEHEAAIDRMLESKGGEKFANAVGVTLVGDGTACGLRVADIALDHARRGIDASNGYAGGLLETYLAVQYLYREGRKDHFNRWPFDGTKSKYYVNGYLDAEKDQRESLDDLSEHDSNGDA